MNTVKIIDCLHPQISSDRVKKERHMLRSIKSGDSNWIGHILFRDCLLRHVIEGKVEWTERRRRRFEQLLDDLEEKRRYLLQFGRKSTRSQTVEISLWKRLWTCRKRDNE
jgi:hypothetical protein